MLLAFAFFLLFVFDPFVLPLSLSLLPPLPLLIQKMTIKSLTGCPAAHEKQPFYFIFKILFMYLRERETERA